MGVQLFMISCSQLIAFDLPSPQAKVLEGLKQGKDVVRLKGGDPFVFGRSAEEIELYATHGFAAEVCSHSSSTRHQLHSHEQIDVDLLTHMYICI